MDSRFIGFVSEVFEPKDQVEERMVRRIGQWTLKLIEHRAKLKEQGLVSGDDVFAADKDKFGNLVGDRLRNIRKQNGLSQEELADRAKISQSAISKIESGHKMLSPNEAGKLAPVLGCSIKFLAIGID